MAKRADYISLDSAKSLIITALDQFHPMLGLRAATVLHDEKRLNILEVDEAKTGMMQCRPAGLTMEDVKLAGQHIPDFVEKFSPHFTRQDNPEDHSIIDFEYDGSPGSVVWLGHETGHAIAYDTQKKNEHSFRFFSEGEMEEQAYFVQKIVSQYVQQNLKRPDVSDANLGQDVLKMSWDRAAHYTNAARAFDEATSVSGDRRQELILSALDQRYP